MSKITNFIDSIIREYKKDNNYCYELSSNDLPKKTFRELVNFLYLNDEAFKEKIDDYVDTLIEERIEMIYAEDMYESGCVPVQDKVNGEISWRYRNV